MNRKKAEDYSQKGVRWVQLWRQNDWGQYMRRNEVFAHEIAKHSTTSEILHIEELTIRALWGWLVSALKGDTVSRLHIRKALSWRPISVSDKIRVISMITLGGRRFRTFRVLNKSLITLQLLLRIHNRPNTILLAYPPGQLIDIAPGILKHEHLIVDLVDDVAGRERDHRNKAYLLDSYRKSLSRSDKNIATHQSLQAYANMAKTGIEVLPNGVNTGAFEKPDAFPSSPSESDRQQIVGYVGSINIAFDESLILECLRSFPGVLFRFYGFAVGEGKQKILRMKEFHNFEYLGPLHHELVPSFLSQCDALVLPKFADHTTSGNDSMKVYQYLATGRPIVSTTVSPSPNYPELIYLADTPQGYVQALRYALSERGSDKSERRVESAKMHSWSKKVDRFVHEAIGLRQGSTNQ